MSENEHGTCTRALSRKRENRDTHFMRACAVEMDMRNSKSNFCASRPTQNAATTRANPDLNPALNSYRKNPFVRSTIWGITAQNLAHTVEFAITEYVLSGYCCVNLTVTSLTRTYDCKEVAHLLMQLLSSTLVTSSGDWKRCPMRSGHIRATPGSFLQGAYSFAPIARKFRYCIAAAAAADKQQQTSSTSVTRKHAALPTLEQQRHPAAAPAPTLENAHMQLFLYLK